jgi:hypothetical protein
MSDGIVDRVAVVVEDVHATANELERLFGIEMRVFDIAAMGCRVGLSDEGFELIQPLSDAPRASTAWTGALAAIGVRVDDLERSRATMAENGLEVTSELVTPGGVRELYYAKGVAGLPTVLAEYGDRGFLREVGADTDGPYEPRYVNVVDAGPGGSAGAAERGP